MRANDHILDVGDVRNLCRRSDEVLLAVPFDISCTDIRVVGGKRRHHVAER